MPAPARMPAMSAPVRASCFGLGVGGAGVEGVAAARGVAELGVEGVDGVGVADGVGSAEGVDVTGGVSIGVCTTRSFLATCYRRVGPPCRAIPPIGSGEVAPSGCGWRGLVVSRNFACNSREGISGFEI